jgi:hypothetical protein
VLRVDAELERTVEEVLSAERREGRVVDGEIERVRERMENV